MNNTKLFEFKKSIKGTQTFPPCASNIKRIPDYDKPLTFRNKKMDKHFISKQLFPVNSQDPDCSNSWLLSCITAISYLYKTELSSSFVNSCYSPSHISNYYNNWGCNGDSIYNALIFLHLNGTVKESEFSGTECTRNSLVNKDTEHNTFTIDKIKNISPILTKNGLVDITGNLVDFLKYKNFIKGAILKNPVITGFVVKKGLLNLNNRIYIESTSDPIIGYHNAVIVGWGEEKIENKVIEYWVLKNSWGSGWNGNGYWKHAMYPLNTISCVDISIHGELIPSIPYSDRHNPMGGVIQISNNQDSNRSGNNPLNMNKLKNVILVKDIESYPDTLWICMFIMFIVVFIKFFTSI